MHIKLTAEYIGTKFFGFQCQPQKRTVQSELEAACGKYFGQDVKVIAAGRTDAGVHAAGQVIGFVCPVDINKDEEDKFLYKLCFGINAFLPADISVKNPEIKEKFNARQEAIAKTYIYKCYAARNRSAIHDEFYFRLYAPPDIKAMRLAAKCLTGTHDFTSFCQELGDKNPVRTIYDFEIKETNDSEIWFVIRGAGFLKNMIRIIVGTLLRVGEGKTVPDDIKKILAGKDRRLAGATVPAKGLILQSVEY